jgi:hypothetical protein
MALTGMKFDTGNNRENGVRYAVLRMVVAVLGLAGIATNSLADDFAGLADPTQPLYGAAAGSAQRPAGSALQSTFISASQRRAVINGRTYKVGDKYSGGIITNIQPYEVVIKKTNNESRLRLLPKLAKETYLVKVPAGSREEGQK